MWPIGFFLRAKLKAAHLLESKRPGIFAETVNFVKSTLSAHHQHVYYSEWRGLPELTNENGAVIVTVYGLFKITQSTCPLTRFNGRSLSLLDVEDDVLNWLLKPQQRDCSLNEMNSFEKLKLIVLYQVLLCQFRQTKCFAP